jgi:hypothetical protein
MSGKPMVATVLLKRFKAGNSEQFSLRDTVCVMDKRVFSPAFWPKALAVRIIVPPSVTRFPPLPFDLIY